MTLESQGGAPNYHPNSFGGPEADLRAKALSPVLPISGDATRYDNGQNDNFSQARLLYQRVLTPLERGRLINNIVDWLRRANTVIQDRAIRNFAQVNEDFGRLIREGIQAKSHSGI